MKTSALIAMIAVGLAGAGVFFLSITPSQAPGPGADWVACTADAMQCPDGSYVGRTGPNCEFVCPAATTTPPTGGGGGGILPYNSGIQGVVMAGPTCPVERDPPDPACADRPLATNIIISRKGSTQVFATVQSNAQGMFQISLPPGEYVVSGGGQVFPRCSDAEVIVGQTGYTAVNMSCDTGIR